MRKTRSRGAIVVGIWSTAQRRPDYSPQAIESRLNPAIRARVAREHGGAAQSDAFLRFVVEELKPQIDRMFVTAPGRASTMIGGSSMGALVSLYGLCKYPQVFGAAACLSTHWTLLSARESYANRDLETDHILPAMADYLTENLPRPGRHRVWMDHGTLNLDSHYGPYQARIDAVFAARSWQQDRDFVSRVYAGADHNEASWRARLDDPVNFLLA